jgi:prenyltransferase beta subunit
MKRILSAGIILLLGAVPVFGQTAEQKKATIAYLQKLQNKDGSFRPSAAVETSSLRATSSALRALKYFGGEVPDRVAAAEFVKKCHDKASGGFADTPGGKPDVAVTAVGLMALVELKVPTETYEAGAINYLDTNVKTFEDIRIAVAGLEAIGKTAPGKEKWLKQIDDAKLLANEKPWGEARVIGGALVAMMRMGFKPGEPLRRDVLFGLNAGQRKDGGFGKAEVPGSDLETSYRVMRCYHMLKAQPSGVAKLREFVAKCRNDDGGYGVAPSEKSAIGPTYFASIILHWLDEK